MMGPNILRGLVFSVHAFGNMNIRFITSLKLQE